VSRERYNVYRPGYLDCASRLRRQLREDKKACRELFGKPLKKVSREALELEAMKEGLWAAYQKQLAYASARPTMEGVIVMEEWCVDRDGGHIYFPAPGMLEELYTAKFDVGPENFILPHRAFTVAVPANERVGGMELPGFMVTAFTKKEKQKIGRDFGNALFGDPMEIQTDAAADEGLALFVTYRKPTNQMYVVRASSPIVRVQRVLDGVREEGRTEMEVIYDVLGWYKAPGALRLSEEEAALHFRMIKSVISLSMYMQCEGVEVLDLYPEMVGAADVPVRKVTPHSVGAQHFQRRERSGPRSHYRSWHFRRYPLKKDGTRRPGLVAVRGAMVVPRNTPHTVVDEYEKRACVLCGKPTRVKKDSVEAVCKECEYTPPIGTPPAQRVGFELSSDNDPSWDNSVNAYEEE
jgi:hypothetical protein